MAKKTLKELEASSGPIANFVRSRRKQLGHSQTQLALRLGVGLRFLKELEQGKQRLQMDKVNTVLAYFGHQLIPGPLPRETDETS